MELSKLNPDWEKAEKHGISTYPGKVDFSNPNQSHQICPCCLNYVNKQKAPLSQNSKELQFLGFGFPLFYVFLKYCIILLLVTICSYNALQLYWSIHQNQIYCSQEGHQCTSFMIEIARISGSVDNAQVIVRIFSFIVHLGVLVYIRDLITKTRNYYDQRTCSLSDYSIIVTNVPQRKGTKRKLLHLLENYMDKKYKVYQITFLPEYEDFYRMEKQIQKIIEQIKVVMNLEENQKKLQKINDLNLQLEGKEKQLQKYCQRQLQLEEKDECIAEKVVFSCATEDQKDQILQKFNEISEQKVREIFEIEPHEECNIAFQEAPQPKQINWQHINYPDHHRLGRKAIGWALTIIFLAIVTVIFFFLLSAKSSLIQHSLQDQHSAIHNFAVSLVYLALIGVIFFNKFIMGNVLHKICDFQRHKTTAEQQFHFALKYAVGMFFTTALMTLAVEDIKFHNFYSHSYGVIEQESIMFFMNALFVPLIWLINPWYLLVLIKRKFRYGRKDMTQKQANKLMQKVQYNMGKRYAQIIEVMWFTFLYSSLIPFGAFLSLIGLCLYYWVDKYNLLRKSSVNSNIAGQLSLFSMKLLDFTLFCKPIGQIIFDSQMRDSYCISSIIMCCFALLYMVLPIDKILQFFHPEKFKNEQKTYQEVQSNFKQTYQTLHPIFSLKQQNQKKINQAFKLINKLMNHHDEEKIEKNEAPIDVQSLDGEQPSAHNLMTLRDSTNIFQAIFSKNNKVIDSTFTKD